ncbi:hypothetical protein KJ885_03460 [Patescibacteria group bacterium]|nr:hypothetical protein [Patescibacteria group bacterium]
MSKRLFNREQINELLKNKNVAKCSEKSLSYIGAFKIKAVKQYNEEGLIPNQIFEEAGFNLRLIGKGNPRHRIKIWRKIYTAKGGAGLSAENRGRSKGGARRNSHKKFLKIMTPEALAAA